MAEVKDRYPNAKRSHEEADYVIDRIAEKIINTYRILAEEVHQKDVAVEYALTRIDKLNTMIDEHGKDVPQRLLDEKKRLERVLGIVKD